MKNLQRMLEIHWMEKWTDDTQREWDKDWNNERIKWIVNDYMSIELNYNEPPYCELYFMLDINTYPVAQDKSLVKTDDGNMCFGSLIDIEKVQQEVREKISSLDIDDDDDMWEITDACIDEDLKIIIVCTVVLESDNDHSDKRIQEDINKAMGVFNYLDTNFTRQEESK